MKYNIFKKYVRRVCIHKNNTLNSQISYWHGQKRFVILNNLRRDGLNMIWSERVRNIWGWGIEDKSYRNSTMSHNNLNKAPFRKKWLAFIRISFLFRKLRYFKFYKGESLKKLMDKYNEVKSNDRVRFESNRFNACT